MASPDYEGLPHREILMDWDEFESLPLGEKEFFVEMAESIERGQWFSRTGYSGIVDWACVDLANYADYEELTKRLKKQGPSFYEERKAEKRGYYSKFFDLRTFIGDIVEIDTSAPERQGRPLFDSYRLTVEQRGGYPTEFREPEVPTQSAWWLRRFGTFHARPAHRQGSVIVDEQLVAYLVVRRFGNLGNYNMILGHKDFLRDGIVHKLHLDFMKTLLDTRNQAIAGASPVDTSLLGLRYLAYGSYFTTTAGLQRWKKSNLFEPGLTCFDYTPALKYSKTKVSQEPGG